MADDQGKPAEPNPQAISRSERLRDGETAFLSLVNSIPACFLRKDRDGRFVFVNEQFAALFGKPAEEIVGKTVADFYSPEFAREAREEDEQVMRTGEVLEDVFEGTVDGQRRYYASRKGPVRNAEGEVIGIQTIFWDITKQRIAENALLAEREELRRAKVRADEANRAKSDFLANMSHEIRTPMNAIIGLTDLLLETQLTPTQHEYLRMIQDSGEALLTLLNDILDFSKIEAGKLELECTRFDIRETLGDSMKGLGFRAHSKGLELAFRVDETIPSFLQGDPGRIRQVVVNLIGNAIKFTEQGEVMLEIQCVERSPTNVTLRFSVIDTGIGITEQQQAKIFQAFEQADASTTRRYGGTGLGLAISSRLVQLMGGRIWVESKLGQGSRFHFEIPLQIDESQTPDDGSSQVDVQGVRVLVVDDNATNRRILKEMLSHWGMVPVTTSGGAPALQALEDAVAEGDAYRLVISDVNMPEMDGLALVQEICDRELLDPSRVIMLTSGARPDDANRLRSLGITRHLFKPAKPSEVHDAIVSSLNAAGESLAEPKPSELPETVRAKTGLNVLLAEDNVVNQKLAVGILERLGHHVTIAGNGLETLQLIEQQPFDLVLMDVQMPEMDGLAATRELRRREAELSKPRIPVIAMTAHAMKGDRERCLAAGMDDYLCKPIRLKEITNKLAQFFSASTTPPPAEPSEDSDTEGLICWPAALANVGGDPQLLRELVQVFLDETPVLMERALTAAQTGDSQTLAASVHSLKGSMLFLNPAEAIRCAEETEQLASDGELDAAQNAIDGLKIHYDAVCQCLKAQLAKA